jgi:hypothetical protein
VNRLIATIHWNQTPKEAIIKEKDFFHSHPELSVERTCVFTFDDATCFYNPETGVVVSIATNAWFFLCFATWHIEPAGVLSKLR